MSTSGRIGVARRLGIAAVGVLVTASCAAGQHAQTANIKAAVDATSAKLGSLSLQGVVIHAPDASSYPVDSNAQLAITLVNTGQSADTLVNVSSPAFTGWGIVDNAAATSTSAISGADTGLTIGAGSAQRLGLVDLGASAALSPRTLVLTGLTKGSSPLFPGSSVDITFRFARAGSTTLHVPVQVTATPNDATLPAQSDASTE